MTAKGHVLLASSATLALVKFNLVPYFVATNFAYFSIFYASAIFGSLFPDIDEKESYIGHKLGAISIITSSLFKHRTVTHYFIFALAIFSLSFLTNDILLKVIVYGISLGVLLHDMGDMLTKGGINGFLFPFLPNTKIALLPKYFRFYTASITEYMFILAVLLPANTFFIYDLIVRGIFR